MEPQGPADLVSDLCDRLHDVELLTLRPTIATLKERRQNVTESLPPYEPRSSPLSSLTAPVDYPGWHPDSIDLLWSCLLEPLRALQRRLPWSRLVPVRLSTKSVGPSGQDHCAYLTEAVRGLSHSRETVVGLRDLSRRLGYADSYALYTSGGERESAFFSEVRAILTAGGDDEVVQAFDSRYRAQPPEADLSVKFIPERGDVRAYTVDRNPLRELLGSAVHSILHPRDRQLRATFSYTSIWRITHKNLISEDGHFPRSVLSVAHGDVSSFTSSLLTLWTSLMGMISWAEEEEREDRLQPVVLTWGACFVECSVSELLRLYVGLTFRMPVYDTVAEEPFVTRGGMLGVSGINTTACVTFACFWVAQLPSLTLKEELKEIDCYMGGDDFRLFMVGGTGGRHLLCWARAKALVTKYIGALSEETLETIPTNSSREGSVFLQARFCKKLTLIRWTHDGQGVRIQEQSQFRIPLHQSFLYPPGSALEGSRREKLEAFVADLPNCVPWIEEQDTLIDVIYRALCTLHGPIVFERRWRGISLPTDLETVDDVSLRASELIDEYAIPVSDYGPVTRDRDEVIHILLRQNRLFRTEHRGVDIRWITHLPQELGRLPSLPPTRRTLSPPDKAPPILVCRLMAAILNTQAALSTFNLDTS